MPMTTDSNNAKRRKIGSRACDACKIRKVRCTEVPPCDRCQSIGITCTFNKVQATRGPRSIRAKTLAQIREAQEQEREEVAPPSFNQSEDPTHLAADSPNSSTNGQHYQHQHGRDTSRSHNSPPDWQWRPPEPRPRVPITSLVVRLCIYRLRLFPVWPIVAVEEVIATLQRDNTDMETYALANAVGAAAMAQLKLGDQERTPRGEDAELNDGITADAMETECRRARLLLDHIGNHEANLNTLRISFFLHVYHENMAPGGTKSLLYLREAITLAQIMGLQRPSTYLFLPTGEQQMRRRIIWLLFVTERGVAMLHKLPVAITSSDNLPSLSGEDGDDEAHILPAFKKLVNLFWIFDQSRAFDLIRSREDDQDNDPQTLSGLTLLDTLRRRFQDDPLEADQSAINDVQKADIYTTRQWMQILLWRATSTFRHQTALLQSASHTGNNAVALLSRPIHIAREFLELIGRVPHTALEAHGPAIEHKIFDIASAVTDAIARRLSNSSATNTAMAHLQPADVLLRLQKMLASCRGGNKNLLASLCARIAEVEGYGTPSPRLMMIDPLLDRVEEVQDRDDGGERVDNWAGTIDDPNTYGGRHVGSTRSRSPVSPSNSQWFPLVAAAELEQYTIAHQSAPASPTTAALQSMVNSLSWQPAQLLSQMRNDVSWSASNQVSPGQMSPVRVVDDAWNTGG